MQNSCKPSVTRIFLADDHPVVISALQGVFEKIQEFEIVGTATSGDALLEALANDDFDLVITDFFMPSRLGGYREDGLSMLGCIRRTYPNISVIVYTMLTNGVVLSRIKKLGVKGIVGKDDSEAVLIGMCRSIIKKDRETFLSPLMLERIKVIHEDEKRSLSKLSVRELEVLRMYASGMSLTDISKKLNRALTTVATQKNSAMKKLKIDCNAEVIKFASERGLV